MDQISPSSTRCASSGPAYKDYLPERFRARSGPYFPSFGWDIFLNGTTGRKPRTPRNIASTLTRKTSAMPSPIPVTPSPSAWCEPDLAVELAKAYNNWAYDFCKSTGNRVNYAAVIAPQVVPEAVKEIRRAVTEKGAVGVMMPTYVQSGLDLANPNSIPFTPRRRNWVFRLAFTPPPKLRSATRAFINTWVFMTSHPFEQMLSIVSIISNGVLDRFPKLRVAFLEAGVGFLPYWMERFDEKYLKRKSEMEPLEMLPSEYVKTNRCYFTCEGEESALPLVIEQFGDDCMMYASDYPHWDTEWPHTVSQVVGRKDISDKTKQKILADNAKSFYRFS